MTELTKPIEEFFFESLLKICLASICIVIFVDFYLTHFVVTRSIIIDGSIFFALVTSFAFYKIGFFKLAVIWIAIIVMSAMFYQSINTDSITTSSMAVILVIGFGVSVLLKEKQTRIIHGIAFGGMIATFGWLAFHPQRYGKSNAGDIIVAGVTYCTLYIIITYSAFILKQRYDEAFVTLALKNNELIEKSDEIEAQNEELVQSQDNLHQLNLLLETLVEDRTKKIKQQNEQLIKYAYSNAHHVRGPVARLLGLIQLSKMKANLDYPFLFEKIEEQTKEIDEVVKSINKELES